MSGEFSGFFENKALGPGRIETGGHVRIAGWVACQSELSSFNPVYGVNGLANDSGIGTFKNRADELLWIGVFSKGEDALAPVVGVRPVEVEGVSGECDRRCAFRFMALVVAGPCALDSSRV